MANDPGPDQPDVAAPAGGRDRIEVWGRRVGRALGLVAAALLAADLIRRWLF